MGIDSHLHWIHLKRKLNLFTWVLLLAAALGTQPVTAQTYISAEPIPSPDVIGSSSLSAMESIGYSNLELWSNRLLNDCQLVQNVINVLSDNRAISTLIPGNTSYLVAAGGFEGITDPTYVFKVLDSGPVAASASDIFVLNNALGYVLNQGGTAQFSVPYNNRNPYEFALDYVVVTYSGALSGLRAKAFFDYVGTINPALWSGTNAGFTQVNLYNSGLDNSMLFLIGKVAKAKFIDGMYQAATTTPEMTYSPIAQNGKPTTASAGVAFPGNDWVTYPGGDSYLTNIPNASPQLLSSLAALRKQHLEAVTNLLGAISRGNVSNYLNNRFSCPRP
jgi:hypothetical protein